jgi:ankyrin repeat protein
VSHEPNLDFYRRRAKELLTQARAGDSSARARFKKHHPDFRAGLHSADTSQPFAEQALNQAQLVVARENGFPSWPRLKAYIEALERSRQQSREDRLQSIMRARDLDALRAFIAAHPDSPRFRIEPVGDTPLHLATGWQEGTEVLLEVGADINAVSRKFGLTPLRRAIRYGDSEAAYALFLLMKGADPNVASTPGKTTMQLAAYARAPGMIRALATQGMPVDIFGAVALDDEAAVRELATDKPAVFARRMRPHENITITPLHLAAFHDLPRMIDVLITLGANRDDQDEQGRTPIDLSLHGGKRSAYERLRALGSEPNAGLLALVGDAERAVRIARLHSALTNGVIDIVRAEVDADATLLNQHFPDVWGTGGTFGATPLHWAAMSGQLEVARVLLSLGASLTATDLTYGGTPLGWARQYRRREMAAFLEAHGSRK